MGLDNVAVQWPRTGRFYDPVAPAEFVDFADLAEKVPAKAAPAAALADHTLFPIDRERRRMARVAALALVSHGVRGGCCAPRCWSGYGDYRYSERRSPARHSVGPAQ